MIIRWSKLNTLKINCIWSYGWSFSTCKLKNSKIYSHEKTKNYLPQLLLYFRKSIICFYYIGNNRELILSSDAFDIVEYNIYNALHLKSIKCIYFKAAYMIKFQVYIPPRHHEKSTHKYIACNVFTFLINLNFQLLFNHFLKQVI